VFFKAAADLEQEDIVSKRAASRYCSGPSRSWLKTKNMVGSDFVLLGTDRDANGIPWALLESDRDGELRFAGPAILHPAKAQSETWSQQMAAGRLQAVIEGIEARLGSRWKSAAARARKLSPRPHIARRSQRPDNALTTMAL
jgi:bifunctional non-homologous end joining protein LigD